MIISISANIACGKSTFLDSSEKKFKYEFEEFINELNDNKKNFDEEEKVAFCDFISNLLEDKKYELSSMYLKQIKFCDLVKLDIEGCIELYKSYICNCKISVIKEDLSKVKSHFEELNRNFTLEKLITIEEIISKQSKSTYHNVKQNNGKYNIILIERICLEHILVFIKGTITGNLKEFESKKEYVDRIENVIKLYINNFFDSHVDHILFFKQESSPELLLERSSRRNQTNDNNLSLEYLTTLHGLYQELYDIIVNKSEINLPLIGKNTINTLTKLVSTLSPIKKIDYLNTSIISYFGNIGSGKTTNIFLKNTIKKGKKIHTISEPIDKWKKGFEIFVANPSHKTYKGLQDIISKTFKETDEEIAIHLGKVDKIFVERIPLESVLIFIRYYLQKNPDNPENINFDEEIERYCSCNYDNRLNKLIILNNYNNTTELYERIKKRNQINDSNITLEYLQELELLYDNFISLLSKKVKVTADMIGLQNDYQNNLVLKKINDIKSNTIIYKKI